MLGDQKMYYYQQNSYYPNVNGKSSQFSPSMGASFNAQQMSDIFTYPQNLQNALDLMQQALGGETADRMFYTWLIDNAPSEEDKAIISGIRDDEISHYALFNQLYYDITGMVSPQISNETFTPPENYCDGLALALLGEQNAVKKYRKIFYAMQYRDHINIMTEIITDEIRHGILYNFLYTSNGCKS